MKGEITLAILGALKETALNTLDLLEAIASSPYGSSYRKLERNLEAIRRKRLTREEKENEFIRLKQKHHKMVYKLEQDGLIKKVSDPKQKMKTIAITKLGLNKFFALKEKYTSKLPNLPYLKENSSVFTIVAFDVPERWKKKRNWLRGVLKNLDLRMVQKSVWLGKVKIPREFVDDLKKLKILDFVEIFEITKSGTLEEVRK